MSGLPLLLPLVATAFGADPTPGPGYHADARVTEATRLDAIFPNANQSPAKPPAGWLDGYESDRQTFELFVPKDGAGKKDGAGSRGGGKKGAAKKAGRPLVLFISPSAKAMGWPHWKETCEKHGAYFAGPQNAGNDCPTPRRVRIVLDVLDEMRRRYDVDPDRTYIAGFSGGGRVACAIAFSLPELFGGVVPICAAGDLREESWLRRRVVDRLSVAHVTGETDFNRGEVERFRGPMLAEVGVRSRVRMLPKLGHGVPGGRTLGDEFDWLEDDLPRRQALAHDYPASRCDREASPTREEQSSALLVEARGRLADPKTLYSGLMQLSGIRVRWNDLPAAEKATEILTEHDGRAERPWEKEDVDEQRRFLIAGARGLDRYASGKLPEVYAPQRDKMIRRAIELWSQVIRDGQDDKAVEEAQRRTEVLEGLLKKAGSAEES